MKLLIPLLGADVGGMDLLRVPPTAPNPPKEQRCHA